MKTILCVTTALAALAMAAPAAAQYSNQGTADGSVDSRIDRLRTRIDAGIQQGTIDRGEAMRLREQLRQLRQIQWQYRSDGISGRERADLQQRIIALRQDLRNAERDRGYGYGQNDRTDGYGRYDNDRNNDGWDDRDANRDGRWDVDSRYDRNNDGWDDRDANRDGRWDVDSRYDRNNDGWDDRDSDRDGRSDDDERDQAYHPDTSTPGGFVNQMIDTLTGGGTLRVGERAPDSLYGVPYSARERYRDGNGVYYRSDGRQIYEIDARDRRVTRIYPVDR